VGHLVSFLLACLAVLLGYWFSGRPIGLAWFALGFSLHGLVRWAYERMARE
jgi:hypothetical protein